MTAERKDIGSRRATRHGTQWHLWCVVALVVLAVICALVEEERRTTRARRRMALLVYAQSFSRKLASTTTKPSSVSDAFLAFLSSTLAARFEAVPGGGATGTDRNILYVNDQYSNVRSDWLIIFFAAGGETGRVLRDGKYTPISRDAAKALVTANPDVVAYYVDDR